MKKLVVLLVVSLMATSAFAVVDPDPNSIGIYFDTTADMVETTAIQNVPFFGYLILANPTEPELSGFEASYRVEPPAGMEGFYFRLAEDLQGGLNVAVGNTALLGEYVVGWPSPRASTSESIILVSWQMMVLMPDMPLSIFLGQTAAPAFDDGLPAIEVGGSIIPAGLSSGDAALPVAKVNDTGVVAEEMSSFGGVKALFR